MLTVLNRLLEPIRNRLILMITKALVTSVSDNSGIQIVQVNLGNNDLIDGVERLQNFGFTSHPEDGTPAIVLCLNGEREHPIVIAVDDVSNRPTLSQGDSAVYNSSGTKITLEGNKVIVDATNIELGTGVIKKLVNEAFQTLYNNHGHDYITPGGPAITGTPVAGIPPVSPPVPITALQLTSKTQAE